MIPQDTLCSTKTRLQEVGNIDSVRIGVSLKTGQKSIQLVGDISMIQMSMSTSLRDSSFARRALRIQEKFYKLFQILDSHDNRVVLL